MDTVNGILSKVRLRLAVYGWARRTVAALITGAALAALWIVAARLFPQLGDPAAGVGVIALGAGLIGAALALAHYPTRVSASLELDKRLGLNERVTSLLETESMSGPMVDALRADAVKKVESLSYAQAFPLVSPRGLKALSALIVAVGLLYGFLPQFDLTGHEERIAEAKANEAAVTVAVERIEKIQSGLKDLEKGETAGLEDIEMALGKMQQELEAGKINEKQLVARLSDLTQEIQERRAALQQNSPVPKLAGDMNQFSVAKEIAAALQKGDMGKAAELSEALRDKMKDGSLSEEEKKKLQKDLKQLSEMLGGQNSELGAALAKAQASMESGDMQGAMEAMAGLEMSLEDMESVMDQLKKLDSANFQLAQWKQGMLGDSEYCRECGSKLTQCDGEGGECDKKGHSHEGECASCAGKKPGSGQGLGLGGPGRGQGNRLGELPEVDTNFEAAKATGPLTKGKMLADIMQQANPELGETPSVEMISGAFVQLQQQTEQALTQEEIPDSSKELVRQYFGALEPENGTQ